MAHKITAVIVKSPDWKLVTILNAAGELVEEVSVNRAGKDGNVFPGFDDIQMGSMLEGKLWQSPKGKLYLFPPKETDQKKDQSPALRDPGMAEIKNLLVLTVMPILEKIHKELIILNEKHGMEDYAGTQGF